MKQLLQSLGYQLNEHGVWQRPEFAGIAYSDGDEIENRIWQAITSTQDRTVLSTDLKRHCTDWPSLYHLSGTRANLMRPLKALFKGDILEIGAGCGAISRYLGECTAGTDSRLLSLEGSPRRAAIARARTQGLQHVTVVTERFDGFAPARQFDVVTLIGVLEYANLFTGGPSAALSMLERARQLVKPGGHLIIAIENQFGLKYFAGAPEDHLGIPMVGIESRYANTQAKTFGKKALAQLLTQAGFHHSEFLAPFPDYKLPVSIISQTGMHTDSFDAAALAWQSVRRDPQLPTALHFSLELAWPDLFSNGLGMDLTNSFLIVAGDQAQTKPFDGTLAWHYSADRRPHLCKETKFTSHDGNQIHVTCSPLSYEFDATALAASSLRYTPQPVSFYTLGQPLAWHFLRLLGQDGWQVSGLAELFQRQIEVLKSDLIKEDDLVNWADPRSLLPGRQFDGIPHNIIQDKSGEFVLIDREWQLSVGVALGHLIFRSCLLILGGLSYIGVPDNPSIKSRRDFVLAVFESLGLSVDNRLLETWAALEFQLQSDVTGHAVSRISDWRPDDALCAGKVSQTVIDSLNIKLQQASALARHHEVLLTDALMRKQAIESSSSWRLTDPLRRLMQWVKR